MAPEIDNVRAVLDWAARRDPSLGLELAVALESYWVVRDPEEGAMRLGRLLELAPDADPFLRAHALLARAGSLDIFGESNLAEPCYRESLELFTACGEEDHAANVRFRIGANTMMRGQGDEAWPLLEAALEEFRARDMPLGEGQVLAFFGEKAFREGDLERSCELFLESAAIAHDPMDVVGAGPARQCCLV